MKTVFRILTLLIISHGAEADIIPARIFQSNMVLQRDTPIPVWGQADPGEQVEIRFHKQVRSTKADVTGKWLVRLANEKAGGPYELTIKGGTNSKIVQLKNVLVGDVWLCSGQSNMEWTVGQSMNAASEISSANNSSIRHIKIDRDVSGMPKADFKSGTWMVCDSTTVSEFTGVGYFFAKQVYSELKIPIGLINVTWGGTNIEAWISREAFESSDEFKEMIRFLPRVDFDSLSMAGVTALTKRIEAMQESKLKTIQTNAFKDLQFDDARWPELHQPQLWEEQRIGDLDGVVWLRKTVMLNAADISVNAHIELSTIDDYDTTYINGIMVGATNQWNAKRKYLIPQGILREGKNVIAIRITDTGGGGGIYGDPADLKLITGNQTVLLGGKWKFQVSSIQRDANVNSFPCLTYNAMIHPIIPYSFKGVLWYQGEANISRAHQYRMAFPLLINDWRQRWGMGDFPFLFVQLASYTTPGNSNQGCEWAELREAQTLTLQVPNTGMCVTTDIGDPNDIHPRNKQEVGRRLSKLALHKVYGRKDIICTGPSFKSMEINGKEIIISFDNIGGGLFTAGEEDSVKGFEIAGEDKVFYEAKGLIRKNTVVLHADKVPLPIAVNFGWTGNASENNLFNKEGFPAVPFRTHEWKSVTTNTRYQILFESFQE